MADPGFPVAGVDPLGGVDLRHGNFLVKMYVKISELGPVEGGGLRRARHLDPSGNKGLKFLAVMVCFKAVQNHGYFI